MRDEQPSLNPKQQREQQRAFAIAVLTQAVSLVESIAQEGKCDLPQFTTCMDFLFARDSTYKPSFYTGAIKAKRILQGQEVRYAKPILLHSTTLLALEKKISRQKQCLQTIAEGMQRIEKQMQYFNDPYHSNIIAAVANLYGETISHYKPRVIIRGKPEYLKQTQHTERIRCLLFAGIRAAWVWRSNGGNTFRLLFGRQALICELEKIRLIT